MKKMGWEKGEPCRHAEWQPLERHAVILGGGTMPSRRRELRLLRWHEGVSERTLLRNWGCLQEGERHCRRDVRYGKGPGRLSAYLNGGRGKGELEWDSGGWGEEIACISTIWHGKEEAQISHWSHRWLGLSCLPDPTECEGHTTYG